MTFRDPGPTRTLHMGTGEVLTILRSGSDTAGEVFEMEAVLPPRLTGPPPHRHRVETETFHVVDGVLRVRIGAWRRDLRPGESVTVTPWTLHGFSNPTDEPTRIRAEVTPAGQLEEQFRVLARAGRLPPLRALARINVAHDLSFHLHGIPDPLQRLLWRALAQRSSPPGTRSPT